MREKILLRKTCSVYANDLHFATVIFPFIAKEIEEGATIKTIFEKNEKENIEKVIKNVGLNSDIKEHIRKIDWNITNINKIKNIFKILEIEIKEKGKIDLIVLGRNAFMQKVNKLIDLWIKNNIEKLEKEKISINVVNCFAFSENKKIENILDNHDYLLKTEGIEEIIREEEFLKAN